MAYENWLDFQRVNGVEMMKQTAIDRVIAATMKIKFGIDELSAACADTDGLSDDDKEWVQDMCFIHHRLILTGIPGQIEEMMRR